MKTEIPTVTTKSSQDWMREWPESQEYDNRFMREDFIRRIQAEAFNAGVRYNIRMN